MKPFEMNVFANARLVAEGQPPLVHTASAWLARLQAGLGHLGASWAARRRRTREVQELATFSDRDLRDLGLARSDLRAISDGAYHRD
jgi:uncharacterized protein YjiS (DUF1127 family)